MMKMFAVIVALGLTALSPAAAMAPGSCCLPISTPAPGSHVMSGKSGTWYTDEYFGGAVTCNESHHAAFDNVTCHLYNAPSPLAGQSGTVAWISDFEGVTEGQFTYAAASDGLSYSGKATY